MLTVIDGVVLLPALLAPPAADFIKMIESIASVAAFRHMATPFGSRMSAAMTNCGALGWVSDRTGYRYQAHDPLNNQPWPAMPELFSRAATAAAAQAGYKNFMPDVCLLNRYRVGDKMGAHQDKDEADFDQPIVSLSFGLPANFMMYGQTRGGRGIKIPLQHGDVLVFGGAARLNFHAIMPIKAGVHPLTGDVRYNLTFRRAG